jgi:hypothetical protein
MQTFPFLHQCLNSLKNNSILPLDTLLLNQAKPFRTIAGRSCGNSAGVRARPLGSPSDSNDPDNITAVKIFTVVATVDSYASNELGMNKVRKESISAWFLNVLGPSVESFRRGAYLPLHVVRKNRADVARHLCELEKLFMAVTFFRFALALQGMSNPIS